MWTLLTSWIIRTAPQYVNTSTQQILDTAKKTGSDLIMRIFFALILVIFILAALWLLFEVGKAYLISKVV